MSDINPVAFTIAELIVQNVVDTLLEIGTHSGYQNDLRVEVLKQDGNAPISDGLTVVDFGAPVPQENSPCGLDEYVMPVGIKSHLIERVTTDPAILRERLTSVVGDIRRALQADVHRGGHAVNTEFDKDEIHVTPAPPHVMVWPKIRFRTIYGDPYRR